MILDTSFLIDFLENEDNAVLKGQEMEREEVALATTTVSLFELWRGFHELNRADMEKACALLDRIRIYPLDATHAKIGGRIAQALDAQGQSIDPEDAMIAGIALEQKETILTRNTKHFGKIPNLSVETY